MTHTHTDCINTYKVDLCVYIVLAQMKLYLLCLLVAWGCHLGGTVRVIRIMIVALKRSAHLNMNNAWYRLAICIPFYDVIENCVVKVSHSAPHCLNFK